MIFTHSEKCDMLESYLVCRKSSRRAKEHYAELYPLRTQPHEQYFLRLYRKFRGNESVFAKTRTKRTFIKSEATEIAVIAYFEANRENSILDIVNESDLSHGTVHRILKKHKFIPYKYKPVQVFLPGDPERRMFFCHWYLNFCRQNVNNFRYKKNVNALKIAVSEKINQIDGRTILKAVREVRKRVQKCIELQGGIFEHLL